MGQRPREIPCRRTGDLLVAFAAHGNGMNVVLQRWVTKTTDAATGCARTGSSTRSRPCRPAARRATSTAGRSPIACRASTRRPGTIPDAAQFGEAALNLSALMEAAFHEPCFAFGSIWMHSRSSTSESAQMQDYLAPHALAARTCAAEGTKFLDANANGQRDSGEPGIPRFVIWADYDGDGVRDAGEPYTVSDNDGRYVLEDIRPPGGSYTLRETLLTTRRAGGTSLDLLLPARGHAGRVRRRHGRPVRLWLGPDRGRRPRPSRGDATSATGCPAQLTVEKELWPADDGGRFDLIVNGTTVVPGAGDGASTTIAVPPGSYDITEAAVPPTDAGAYRSTVRCRPTTRRRSALRTGTGYTGLVLRAGEHATCTFTNVRSGTPGDRDREDRPDAGADRRHPALHARRHQPRRRAAAGRCGHGHATRSATTRRCWSTRPTPRATTTPRRPSTRPTRGPTAARTGRRRRRPTASPRSCATPPPPPRRWAVRRSATRAP